MKLCPELLTSAKFPKIKEFAGAVKPVAIPQHMPSNISSLSFHDEYLYCELKNHIITYITIFGPGNSFQPLLNTVEP